MSKTDNLFDPADQFARQRIVTDLKKNLFVQAGAGTGKTSALIDRFVALVASGVLVEHIAAITFTDRAATELRDRIRQRLEVIASGQSPDARTAAQALIEIDSVALCTLHGFAQRILNAYPIEAGLPPVVEVMDEVSSLVDFNERWNETVETLLSDSQHSFTILIAFEFGIRLSQLRSMARRFDDNWDLLDARLATTVDPQPINIQPILANLREVVELRDHCISNDDKLAQRLKRVGLLADRLEKARNEPTTVVQILIERNDVVSRQKVGDKKNWVGIVSVDEVRNRLWEVGDQLDEEMQRLNDEVLNRLVEIIGRNAVVAAEHRRRLGQLNFHDLLAFTKRVLNDEVHGPVVRSALANEYRHLLLDEFQDTDPIQIELAALIADPETITSDWRNLKPKPGSLFFVGDPKQSIYGFRRADMALYLDAYKTFGENAVQLKQNFRTTKSIIDWINKVFNRLIYYEPKKQPEYIPLETVRTDPSKGPPVVLIGANDLPKSSIKEIRQTAAADVATTISTALSEGWTVENQRASNDTKQTSNWRPCEPRDFAILVPNRNSVSALASALSDNDIPHQIEAGFDPLASDEIQDLLITLQAIDDPTDELALATALRSPLFGCGDDELFEFSSAGGRWNHQDPGATSLSSNHPVLESISWIAGLHARRTWEGAADLIESLVRDRRAMELALCSQRPRDTWRRIRTFLDTARTFGATYRSDLRSFLTWCQLHFEDEIRMDEVSPVEPDDNAVHILTMHAAKGLEFPICILADLGNPKSSSGPLVYFPEEGEIAVALNKKLMNAPYRIHENALLYAEHLERLRVLYVASTRARDHLVLALHRSKSTNESSDLIKATSAEVLHSALFDLDSGLTLEPTALPAPPLPSRTTKTIPDQVSWAATLGSALETSNRQRTISATSLTENGSEIDRFEEHIWENKAEQNGSAIGRAVHSALEKVALDGTGIAESQEAASAENVNPDAVLKRVAAALSSHSIKTASKTEHWRELYVAVPITENLLLEGYIDLVFRHKDGLIILDYKTDILANENDLEAKINRYRLQGAAYALALNRSTGLTIYQMTFCFLDESKAIERNLEDLSSAMNEVERRILATDT